MIVKERCCHRKMVIIMGKFKVIMMEKDKAKHFNETFFYSSSK